MVQPWVLACGVQDGDAIQITASNPFGECLAATPAKLDAHSLGAPTATVGGGRAPNPEDDLSGPGVEGVLAMAASKEQMEQLIGHQFPGGRYEIQHWENYLLTEATGREPMAADLAHPVHLFHVPIAGVGTSIAALFALAQSESDAAVTIDYYDWELFAPLREQTAYRMSGGIVAFAREAGAQGQTVDVLTFAIDVAEDADPQRPIARVEFRWRFWRGDG